MMESPLARFVKLRGSHNQLTAREREIIEYVVAGLTNREISQRLGVTIKTVDNHRSNLREKLHLRNGADIARWAASQPPHCATCTCGGDHG